jgi:subtilisin family serine protease
MNVIKLIPKKLARSIPVLMFFCSVSFLNGQPDSYSYFYRIYFADKGDNETGNFLAADLLSERARFRREKSGIEAPDFRDIPVFSGYIKQVSSMGLTLHCTSKWMNTGLFKAAQSYDPAILLNLPFIKDVKTVRTPAGKSNFTDKLDFSTSQADFPPYDQPITLVNGHILHDSGFDGKGILIAILDGGFYAADIIPSLKMLHFRKGIKETFDFVTKNDNVYDYHTHGTAVLSILAGWIEGTIKGTAPGADFLLFRTEDTNSEFPVEEDYWAAAAEFADSAGADIISSSLGYGYFDDPLLDYKFADLDGNSTFITCVADIAASKGMLVFSSAGNERNKEWIRILAPSDGDSVMSVGAVDGYGNIAVFSSAGPSSDGRIKPDNSTMGVSVTIQTSETSLAKSSGTSFSCPVLSGMTACLMQAIPDATNNEIIDALHSSSDRFNSPDSLYGYGIPDMAKALIKLQDIYLEVPDKATAISPNPTPGEIEITFKEPPGKMIVEIFSSSGIRIYRKEFNEYAGRRLTLNIPDHMGQGLYFVRLNTGTGVYLHKIIKLSS